MLGWPIPASPESNDKDKISKLYFVNLVFLKIDILYIEHLIIKTPKYI